MVWLQLCVADSDRCWVEIHQLVIVDLQFFLRSVESHDLALLSHVSAGQRLWPVESEVEVMFLERGDCFVLFFELFDRLLDDCFDCKVGTVSWRSLCGFDRVYFVFFRVNRGQVAYFAGVFVFTFSNSVRGCHRDNHCARCWRDNMYLSRWKTCSLLVFLLLLGQVKPVLQVNVLQRFWKHIIVIIKAYSLFYLSRVHHLSTASKTRLLKYHLKNSSPYLKMIRNI